MIQSVFNNFKIIKLHISVFFLKTCLIYLFFLPLRNTMDSFFSGRTINNDIFNASDIHSLQEFFRYFLAQDIPSYGIPLYTTITLAYIILFLFIIFILMDSLIDAGLLSTLKHGKGSFFNGIRTFGINMLKLRLLNIVPYLFMLVVCSLPFLYFYIINEFSIAIIISAFLSVFILFNFKVSDIGKHLILEQSTVKSAFIQSYKTIFINFNNTLKLNSQTTVLFLAGLSIYMFFDDVLVVDSSLKIWIMILLHQMILLGKQLLRYAYMDAIKD